MLSFVERQHLLLEGSVVIDSMSCKHSCGMGSFLFPIFVCSKPQEIMQTVTIPEQEYLQMKQTIQALQQQVMLMQDKEFMQKLMQFVQVFMLVNQEVVQENKAEQETIKTPQLKSLEQFKGGLANYQEITTTKTEWYEQ